MISNTYSYLSFFVFVFVRNLTNKKLYGIFYLMRKQKYPTIGGVIIMCENCCVLDREIDFESKMQDRKSVV